MNESQIILGFWRPFYYIGLFIFVLLDIGLCIIFVYAFQKGLQYRPHFGKKSAATVKARRLSIDQAELKHRWEKIQEKALRENIEGIRIAIIEADAFVDFILKELGVPGEHFSDRLSNVNPDNIRSIDNLWRAHRVRNSLVHTPGYQIDLRDGKTLFRYYEEFLKEINIL
jgi:hypothetical protein